MRRLLALAALGLVVGSACGYGGSAPYRPRGVADPEARSGRELFMRDCAWCHGSRAEGTPRGTDLLGDRHGGALTDFVLRTGRMPIDDPNDPIRRGPVAYSEEEIGALTSYLVSLGAPGPDVPEPRPERGDLALGMSLYQQNCAACHSTTGVGGALTSSGEAEDRSGLQAPPIGRATPTEVAESMLTGPGTMPVFERLSPAEVDAIVAYVGHLQGPHDEGGTDLGRIGPVAEGAVAWVVGLGAMVIVTRLVGSRRPRGGEDHG